MKEGYNIMKKYEAPVAEVVSFEEEIMLGFLLGEAEMSRIEDGGDSL